MARGRGGIKGALVGFIYASFASVVGTLMHQTQVADEIPIGLLFSLSLVLMLRVRRGPHRSVPLWLRRDARTAMIARIATPQYAQIGTLAAVLAPA